MVQNVMQSAARGQRKDYYRDIAFQLHQADQPSELGRLALCLGQRYRQYGDSTLIPIIDYIAGLLCEGLGRLPQETLVDFTNGSLEIGWLFNTLRALGIPGAFNFPYEDFNEFLYRRLVFEHSNDISLRKGALGRGAYLLSNYENNRRTPNEDKRKAMELHECLVHLVEDTRVHLYKDDMYERTIGLFNPNNEILHLLLFLSRMIDLHLYPEVARQILGDVLDCVAAWLCQDNDNPEPCPAMPTETSLFRSSFESWEFIDLFQAMPAKYHLTDHFIGLPAYCSKDRLCERLVSRLSPDTFVNYLNHEAIKVSGIVRLLEQLSLHAV